MRGAGVLQGAALLVALGLLETVTSDGGGGLAATALLLAISPLASSGGRTASGLRSALAALHPLIAFVAVVGAAVHGAVTPGVPGLATVARGVAALAAALLPRTVPALFPLQALAALLVLWTAAALEPRADAARALTTLLCLVLLAQALALARSAEARADAASSAGVGTAPRALPLRASPRAALLAAALAAFPAGLGLAIPRPLPGGRREPLAEPEPVQAARPAPVLRRGGRAAPTAVRFESELRFDDERGPLREDDGVVAVVRAVPEPRRLYLRGAALERFTATGFFPPEQERELHADRELPVELAVTLERRLDGRLLVAGRALSLGDLPATLVPGAVLAPPNATYPLTYRARCVVPHPAVDVGACPAALDPRWLEVPDEVRAGPLAALAAEAVIGDEPAERARAVAAWLGERCVYDLRAGARGRGVAARLRSFLIDDRRGVCGEFAAAAAALLRLSGVPCRVATGFRVAEHDAEGAIVLRERDAHAWVELPLEGAGWVAFDPTPDLRPASRADSAFASRGEPEGALPDPGQDTREQPAPAPAAPSTALPARALGAAALLLLALAAAAGLLGRREVALARRAELGAPPEPDATWADARERLFALLAARGFLAGRSLTPREWLASLPAQDDRRLGSLREALDAYTQLRFGGRDDPEVAAALARALAAAR